MSKEIVPNQPFATNQLWGIHKLVRAMAKAGMLIRASSDGTTKVVSDDPTSHTAFPLMSIGSGSAASVTAIEDHSYGKLITLTGLTGLVAPDNGTGHSVGNYLTLSGAANGAHNGTFQIYRVLSATSAKILIRSGSPAGTDANNGSIAWAEKDILADTTYGLDATQWWVLLESFRNLQLTGTIQPVGEFVAGETVTQTGTGATGRLIGRPVWGPITGKSSCVIMPMGGQFNSSGVITGNISGATMTPATLYEFARNIVFSKGSAIDTTTGSGWYEVYDTTAEASISLVAKASDSACTATVAPGGSTTPSNAKNTGFSYVLRGDNPTASGNPVIHATGIIGEITPFPSITQPNGRYQIVVSNHMPYAGEEVDGTWRVVVGNTGGGGVNMLSQERVDSNPDNEVDVLVSYAHADTFQSGRRGYTEGANRVGSWQVYGDNTRTGSTAYLHWFQVLGRAAEKNPLLSPVGAYGMYMGTTASYYARNNQGSAYGYNRGLTVRLMSYPDPVPPGFSEGIGVNEGFWGRLRHFRVIQQGGLEDTADNLRFIQVAPFDGATQSMGMIVGPWDQATNPAFSI
jgi:hypothetical protein